MLGKHEITLTEAALRLKVGYNVALRLVLVGRLQGRKEGNRWLVSQRSLSSYVARKSSTEPVPAA